jgi:tagatose-6-phosphate ketose/aldose isomerase
MKTQVLGLTDKELERYGSTFTAKEIYGQPTLWMKTFELFSDIATELNEFLSFVFAKQNIQMILTGAGTSAYIGEVLVGPMQKHTGVPARAVPTTDLVTHPELYILKDYPTLLVSFARSGNSPESVKAVELANKVSSDIFHLIITCNAEGELAKNKNNKNTFVLILPPESNDKSLAMTGSFSSMLLVGLLIANINRAQAQVVKKQVERLFSYGNKFLNTYYIDEIKKIAKLNFERAVFLGSALFSGIARESHLKLQELTDGQVICKHDSFLGFRHGPKAVIDDKTLLVYLFSNNPYSQLYEIDLVNSVNSGRNGCYKVGVMEKDIPDIKLDTKIIFSENDETIDEEFLTIAEVLFAQTLGFYKSIELGLKPDSPSVSGLIHRVVQGVKLYDYNGRAK